MRYTTDEIATICNAQSLSLSVESKIINRIEYDSRSFTIDTFTLFIALDGNYTDGHKFINEVYNKGCRSFLVSKDLSYAKLYPDAVFLFVDVTIKAFHLLAKHHRSEFTKPVLAITGSNGKTTVKEWIYELLSGHKKVVKSPKSFNSQLGVPLSVMLFDNNYDLGILELGISKPNEMELLIPLAQPDVVVFTNIGSPHQANFETLSEKLNEKLLLLQSAKTIIYCLDDEFVATEISKILQKKPKIKVFSWGKDLKATLRILEVIQHNTSSQIELLQNNEKITIDLPFSAPIWIENAMHVIAFCRLIGESWADIKRGLHMLKPLPMRMQVKSGKHNSIIINDSYSADIESLEAALGLLQLHSGALDKVLIIGEFDEIYRNQKEVINRLETLIQKHQLSEVVSIGNFDGIKINSKVHYFNFPSVKDFLKLFDLNRFNRKAILIKGARRLKLEQIVNLIQEKSHLTKLEINLEAIRHNLAFFKSQLKQNVAIMAMVKAFSYGAGAVEIAKVLQKQGVSYLAVAYADEGVHLREEGIDLPIMVMNSEPDAFEKLLRYNLQPEIYSFSILKEWIKFLENQNIFQPKAIHINIDTGMNRLGFSIDEIPELILLLKSKSKLIFIESVFSHLIGSDSDELIDFTHQQAKVFKSVYQKFELTFQYSFKKHILNTSGIINYPEYQFDMVRIGLGIYGLEASKKANTKLRNALSLVSSISQIRQVKKGDSVGYGKTWTATRDSKIATIPIGYADGFSRRLSNGVGEVMINHNVCKVVGKVCMDMTMIDISDVKANEGDEVIIFDSDLSIYNLAEKLETIPYEIIASISARVKRVYLDS